MVSLFHVDDKRLCSRSARVPDASSRRICPRIRIPARRPVPVFVFVKYCLFHCLVVTGYQFLWHHTLAWQGEMMPSVSSCFFRMVFSDLHSPRGVPCAGFVCIHVWLERQRIRRNGTKTKEDFPKVEESNIPERSVAGKTPTNE